MFKIAPLETDKVTLLLEQLTVKLVRLKVPAETVKLVVRVQLVAKVTPDALLITTMAGIGEKNSLVEVVWAALPL